DHEVMAAPAKGELPEGWQSAETVVWSQWPVDAALIAAMPNLRFMQRIGRFRAQGDPAAALQRGIPVSVLPHGTSGRVAEHTLALIMGLFRGLLASHESVLKGTNPAGLAPTPQLGGPPGLNWARLPGLQSLFLKTIGIAGFGEIGACLALLLRPFGCRVLYHKRTPLTHEQEAYFGVTYASLDELLSTSDAVCDLVPVSDATRSMLGGREFGLMKPSAYFVNTGRAATTDEEALVAALSEGRIAGAGLDVFSLEPLPTDHPFTRLPNVLLTPHTAGGGGTPERVVGGLGGWIDTFERLAENLRRVQAGEPVINPMLPTDPTPGGA
ncbi:MAG TPA: NAD(P)-dependent oxidoreductase, partial [Dehalococcoidia bacterium]|nr:NAD(P)-dependent oxidoreductase [Dehalococcoidia bacterium]